MVLFVTFLFSKYIYYRDKKFIKTIQKDDKYIVIHNGNNESKTKGTYTIKVYKSNKLEDFLYGSIQKRVGKVKDIYIKDINFDNKMDLIVEIQNDNKIKFDIFLLDNLRVQKISSKKTYNGYYSFGNGVGEFTLCDLDTKYSLIGDKRVIDALKTKYNKITSMPYQEIYLKVKGDILEDKLKIEAILELKESGKCK